MKKGYTSGWIWPVKVALVKNDARRRLKLSPLVLGLCIGGAVAHAFAENGDFSNAYRISLQPYHKITDSLTGFGYLGYTWNPDNDSAKYNFGWPRLSYSVNSSVQLWTGLLTAFTDNSGSADQLELRPFAGLKLFLPNQFKWNIYNFTRYEFRDIEDLSTHEWTGTHRLRSRFGVELPLRTPEKAWQPSSWYALADVEPFFRFDEDVMDPLRVRGGIGYILSDRIRIELIYQAEFSRSNGSGSRLEFSKNLFRLNIRIGLQRGVLDRLLNPQF